MSSLFLHNRSMRTVMINTFSSRFTEWAWKMWRHVQCCLDCSWHHCILQGDCRPVLQNASICRLPTILLLTFPCILVAVSISLLRECKFDSQHCHLLYTATSIGHIGHSLRMVLQAVVHLSWWCWPELCFNQFTFSISEMFSRGFEDCIYSQSIWLTSSDACSWFWPCSCGISSVLEEHIWWMCLPCDLQMTLNFLMIVRGA